MSVACWGDSSVTFRVVESDGKGIGIEFCPEFCYVQNSGATDSPVPHFGGATVAHTQRHQSI
jgi:hypothetical protein